MNGYHLVYSSFVTLRNFSYGGHKKAEEGEEWKEEWKLPGIKEASGPAGLQIPYRIWMRNPANRAVLLCECTNHGTAFGVFGRLIDLVRMATDGVRPWRIFAMIDSGTNGWGLLYEIKWVTIGDEYIYSEHKLVKLRELTGIVGDEWLKKGLAKP